MDLTIKPLTPARWADLEALFGANGACGGCWCMFHHQNTREYAEKKGATNRRLFRKRVESGAVPGLIGYRDGEPVAWIAIEPRTNYSRLMRSRNLRAAEQEPVWSAPCFFVRRGFRKQGLSRLMLEAAVAHARKRGAALIEGYPVEWRVASGAAFIFPGTVSTFRGAGFREVARQSPLRPIMRKSLKR
jgi:GNAT superfamily N-acetyltransferase